MSHHDDYMDDYHTFGDASAFVTISSLGPGGEYTDFLLSPEQVRVMFAALAEGARP